MTVWLLSQDNFIYGSILIILLVVLLIECLGLLCKADVFGLFDHHQYGVLSSKHIPPDHLTSYWYSVSGSGWLLLFLFLFSLQGLAIQYCFKQYADVMVSEFWIFTVSGTLSITMVATVFLRFQFLMRRALIASPPENQEEATQHELTGAVAKVVTPPKENAIVADAIVLDHQNKLHQLKVKPLESSEQFAAGDKVILIHKGMSCWLASRSKQR